MADDLKPAPGAGADEPIIDAEIAVDTAPPSGTAIEPAGPAPTELIVAETPGQLVPYQAKPSTVSVGVQRRFSAAYGVVVAIFVIGALGTAMALSGFRPGAPAAWSAFKPSGERLQRAQAIADYVAPDYKLDDAKQMVVVAARDAGVGSQQIQFVAVPGQEQYDIINGANTVAYEMCGLGEHCSISTGQPSTDRDRLLRREALEIALYTFKYIGATDAVVVFMPPPVGATTSWALLFKKQDYGSELGHPITETLPEPAPNPTSLAGSGEREMVEQLTGNARYSYKVQDVNGAPVLVLDPPAT
ncbi:MAG: hypothetical protein ABIM89_09915 [Mycobacteriales bacterium]